MTIGTWRVSVPVRGRKVTGRGRFCDDVDDVVILVAPLERGELQGLIRQYRGRNAPIKERTRVGVSRMCQMCRLGRGGSLLAAFLSRVLGSRAPIHRSAEIVDPEKVPAGERGVPDHVRDHQGLPARRLGHCGRVEWIR